MCKCFRGQKRIKIDAGFTKVLVTRIFFVAEHWPDVITERVLIDMILELIGEQISWDPSP